MIADSPFMASEPQGDTQAWIAPGEPIISLRGVTKSFGSHTVLEDITFDVPKGRITPSLDPPGPGNPSCSRTSSDCWSRTEARYSSMATRSSDCEKSVCTKCARNSVFSFRTGRSSVP
jgi:ABC-type transporter Mla maintaining outer membrane lipid asymmetry ATPase subunit MlaF